MSCSKPALLEGLEVDQFMWSIIQNPACLDAEDAQVDAMATVKPLFLKTEGSVQPDVKPILATSVKLPNMGAWDLPSSKSPALYAPPDMNSIVSGQYPLEEGPLSQMSDAVNSLEAHHGPHTPCTPHTPGLPATPHTPGTGHKSPRSGINRYFNPRFLSSGILESIFVLFVSSFIPC